MKIFIIQMLKKIKTFPRITTKHILIIIMKTQIMYALDISITQRVVVVGLDDKHDFAQL